MWLHILDTDANCQCSIPLAHFSPPSPLSFLSINPFESYFIFSFPHSHCSSDLDIFTFRKRPASDHQITGNLFQKHPSIDNRISPLSTRMPSDKKGDKKGDRRRRPFCNEDDADQPEEGDSGNSSNQRVDPDLPEINIIGPTDLVLICIEALRGKTTKIKPTFVAPADSNARTTTHKFAIQTERGVETNRLRVETLRRKRAAQKADRRRDGLPSDSEDSDDDEV